MRQEIVIDKKIVPLESNGGTLLIYKSLFKRDLLNDLSKMIDLKKIKENENVKFDEVSLLEKIDTEIFYNIAYVLARTCDSNIKSNVIDWVSQFEVFPISDIFPIVVDLVIKSILPNLQYENNKQELKKKMMQVK